MLDANNTIPLYLQLKELIKNAIILKEYKNGEQLPTEPELCSQYNVSRITVRKAVEELCKEGFLVKKQGKGTFVKQRKLQRKMEHLLSFTQACANNGMTPSTSVLKREIVRLEERTAEEFGMEPNLEMVMIQRLRKADGTPVMLENNYYPRERFGFLLEERMEGSLYQLLEEKYGIVIESSRDTYLDVGKADAQQARILEVGCGEPLFCMQTKIYDRENALVHIGREYIVCERYRFGLVDYYRSGNNE